MDVSLLMTVRALHVVLGALWLGAALLMTAFLMPAMRGAGAEGAAVMAQLGRRRLDRYILAMAWLTALTGLWLYWRVSDSLQPAAMLAPSVVVLGIGALCGLVALGLVNLVLVPSIKGSAMAMGAANRAQGDAERDAELARMTRFQNRFVLHGRIMVTLMIVAVLCMSLTHLL